MITVLRQIVAAVAAALVLAAPPAVSRPLDDVVESGTLVVAVYRDYPPFSHEGPAGLAGIDVDIARHIAADLGVGLELMPVTADETVDDDLRNAVWRGDLLNRKVADLMLHIPVDHQFALRNKQAVIFGAYFLRRIALAYDPEAIGGGDSPLLAAETIAVELDSIADFYLTGAFGGTLRPRVLHVRSVTETAEALRTGRVAAIMAPQSEIEGALGPDRDRFRIEAVAMGGFARSTWPIGAAVREDSRDLRYAVEDILAAMVADGRMARIFADHHVSYRPPDPD